MKKVKRTQVLGGKERALGPNCASYDGYNLHAGVHLDAMDRTGLERLCRYVLRPPLALPRVERFQGVDGRTMVRIEMKRTYSDGGCSDTGLGPAHRVHPRRFLAAIDCGRERRGYPRVGEVHIGSALQGTLARLALHRALALVSLQG